MRQDEFAETSPQPKKARPLIAHKLSLVSPPLQAALLIVARSLCEKYRLPAPEPAQILAATGATRSVAYAHAATLPERLPSLFRPRGRPPKRAPATQAPSAKLAALSRAVLDYVLRHPGCVHKDRVRQQYSDGFRHFLLGQRAEYAAVDLEQFADAVQVPLGTLKDWLQKPAAALGPAQPHRVKVAPCDVEPAHIQTVLDAWSRWHGSFLDFCTHVQGHLLIPFGIALIRTLLFAHGVRRPATRAGRSPDELALRGSFVTHFPGAQWIGDGMTVPVVIDDQRFTCNLELDLDAHTAAQVGLCVRAEEDSQAVVEALDSGVATTGARPMALLLDNRPCNKTAQVEQALGDTVLLHATPQRPQNKAHAEGAFGLFSRVLPLLALDTRHGPQHLAASLVCRVATVWAQTLNHRPRKARGGLSRVQLYSQSPSPEQVQQARTALRELAQRQQQARRTVEQRRRPEVLALLHDHFARLNLLDPQAHVPLAIAAYPLDAIVAGLACFTAKQEARTLPQGADARYLLGIVRNLAAVREGEHLARALLQLRLEARDRMLAPLCAQRDSILASDDLSAVCADLVDRALCTPSPLCRLFWLQALAQRLAPCPLPLRSQSFLSASKRIYSTFAVSPKERQEAVRTLAEHLVPLA
jgi:hypothetical protein